MASVYYAEDKKFDTTVTIKVLSKDLYSNENIQMRFLAEAISLQRIEPTAYLIILMTA